MHNEQPSTPKAVRRARLNPWVLLPLTAFALALGVGVAYKYRQARRLEQAAHSRPPLPAASSAASRALNGGHDSLNESLLTDSILSIVQSYYVDPSRVENRGLLETALAALATNPRVRTGSSEGGVWVEVDGERQLYPLKKDTRYQDVLDIYAAVARQLDDAGITLVTGELPEKNAPASVALLNGMLSELDAHSALLSPDAYRELRQGTEGSFGGLGVLVGIRDNLLTVIKPLPHSPAARAGIKKRDRILGIDGMFTYGYSLDDLVEYMRGDPGTEVQLSLLRDGAHAPSSMALKREVIHVDSVTVDEINKKNLKVLHLTVENFASRTSREVLSAIKRYKLKTGGVLNGLILDLRSNPGGLLDQAVQVSDLFLQSGVIVTTKGRRDEVETAGSGFDEIDFPLVVLIDGDSASASEIVAGALQDHGRAVVIGQPSFGKGSVQTIFELPGERALKLTIARYYTPAGRSIQNVGIIPDVWLQPVAKTDTNENMFGPYRYKNERFLRNHLENAEAAAAGVKDTSLRLPTRKAYYLADKSDDDDTGAPHVDQEMDLALKMIDKIHATYGDKLPEGTARASHWLGLAGPLVADAADRLDRETVSWLKSQHKIDWTPPAKPVLAPDVELHLSGNNPTEITTGEELNIAWTIDNHESFPVERVSVFVRSDQPGFETKEVLVGGIPAGASRSGSVQITVPSNWEPGALMLRVGAAVDAWPARGAAADYLVQVNARPVAQLSATAELVDELGGKVPGVLEGKEKARLRIDIANFGEVDASDLSVKVVNLAGSQVQVAEAASDLEELATGEQKHVYVTLQGARTLYTPELAFGLYVESPDLRTPYRQRFTIKSLPNAETAAKSVPLMSH